MGACAECQQNCILIHGQHDPDPVVTSFFKPMICNDFLETLYLPPSFAPTVSHLVDQEIYLEDSIGSRSKATISTCSGSLAIQRGWPKFTSDHNVERGDFLVFYFIKVPKQHFVVHIYSRSACLKTNFGAPKNRSNEIALIVTCLPDQYENGGVNSMNKESSTTSKRARTNNHDETAGVNSMNKESSSTNKRARTNNGDDTSGINSMNKESSTTLADGKMIMEEKETNQMVAEDAIPLRCAMPASRPAEKAPDNYGKMVMEEKETDEMVAEDAVPLRCAMPASKPAEKAPDNCIFTHEKMKSLEKEPKKMEAEAVIPLRYERPASSPAERASDDCIFTHEKVKSQEKEKPKQMGADAVIPLRSVMPGSNPAERASDNCIFTHEKMKSPEKEPKQMGAETAIPLRSVMPASSPVERASDDCIFTHEKMKSQEKQPKQMVAETVIPLRYEMPENRHAERKSILTSNSEARNHVKSEVAIKDAMESITSLKNKMSSYTAEGTRVIKKEPMETETEDTGKELNMTKNSYKAVKTEPVVSADTSAFVDAASKGSCLVRVNRQDFLELPDCWPRKGDLDKKNIVLLKDGEGRVWPTFYNRSKHFIALTGGWKEFCAANRLKPKDKCVFQAGKLQEYSVDIRRK